MPASCHFKPTQNSHRSLKEVGSLRNPPSSTHKTLLWCPSESPATSQLKGKEKEVFRTTPRDQSCHHIIGACVYHQPSHFKRRDQYQELPGTHDFAHGVSTHDLQFLPPSFSGPRSEPLAECYLNTENEEDKMFVCTDPLVFTPVYEHSPKYAHGLCTGILQKFLPAYTGAKIPRANIPMQ